MFCCHIFGQKCDGSPSHMSYFSELASLNQFIYLLFTLCDLSSKYEDGSHVKCNADAISYLAFV